MTHIWKLAATTTLARMGWRYFKAADGDRGLCRIDTTRFAADSCNPDGWTENQGLLRIVFSDDNLDWVEIDSAEADRIAARIQGANTRT